MTVLLFNRVDDISDKEENTLKTFLATYKSAGYDCLKISGKKGINIDKLKLIMKGKSCVFSGHSGVGKSTLINRLDSKINTKTLPISKSNLSGQHTTTFSEMYDLEFGSRIIDTPGIKGFGLFDVSNFELKDFFKEFICVEQCKFNNCLHLNEPKCVIKEKVKELKIAESRYQNYVNMINDEDLKYR